MTCLPPIVPEVPVFPPPKGDVGPCEDLEYTAPDSVYGHEFISHVINSWDDSGHIVAQTSFAEDGTQTSTKTRRFDQCGHLIWEETSTASTVSRMENEYSSDGYLVRHAESAGSTCTVYSFAYTFDAIGRVDAQLDGQNCGWTTRYSYDQGRLTGIGWQGAGAGYTYFPDGKMSSSYSSGMSISDSTRYDEAGAPVASSFSSDAGAAASSEWSYGPAHELLKVHEDSSYCGGTSTDRTFQYDGAGQVVHEEVTVTRWPCVNPDDPPTTVVTTVDYDSPAPGLQIADTKDASGNSIKRVKTSFDARGNVTAVDQAMAPDFTWLPISRRNYDCWAR